MKKYIAAALALVSFGVVAADHMVDGYVKKDGTYVAPHMQTAPDANVYNNYSTRGNTNPYTGQAGYVDPYKAEQRKVDPYAYKPVSADPYAPRK